MIVFVLHFFSLPMNNLFYSLHTFNYQEQYYFVHPWKQIAEKTKENEPGLFSYFFWLNNEPDLDTTGFSALSKT